MRHHVYNNLYRIQYRSDIMFVPEEIDIPFQYMMSNTVLSFEPEHKNHQNKIKKFSVFVESAKIDRTLGYITYKFILAEEHIVNRGYLSMSKLNRIIDAIESISILQSVANKAPSSAGWIVSASPAETLTFFQKYPKLF